MTYSILAQDPETGAFGAAVASRFFAVGAICTHAEGRIGALSTQALVNPTYGPLGMARLRAGAPASAILDELTDPDPGRAQRQLHIIDAAGKIAQFTGADCVDWAGHRHAPGVSVAGNMLAGPAVLDAMLDAYARPADFALRLLAALQAGEDAGGDKRGRQSAALRIHKEDSTPDLDIRADDHPDPLAELRRLHRVSLERYAVFRRFLAGRSSPWGEFDRAAIDAAIARDGQPL